ncbi:MAG: lipid IV(A) 3-deoxy-D-manno-octulosonic acid transferase [Gammaproteobacteria bacterium]|nr:lipid IV(A) 3-deoxy-D-manno-octulosonic acid transferase [Gammaproteobacteria bacterium]
MRSFYIVITYLLIPVVLLHLFWKGFGNSDYWKRIGERFGFYPQPPAEGVIWVHAVSVGEVQAAASLVRSLLRDYPNRRVLVTTTTPTGSDRVKALFGDAVLHCYAPLDVGWSVKSFFRRFQPRIAIVMETELWPNLFRQCGARRVPLVLASARLSPKSIGRYRALVSLFKDTLSHGVVIAAQTQADAERFLSLGVAPERTHVTGNIKFDFELADGVREQGIALRAQHAGDRPVWIAASTHSGEEEVVLDAHRQVQQTFADALLILVPRHPERFDGIATLLRARGFNHVRRSHGEVCGADTEVLLGDTMGELMAFYAATDVALVAGSLTKIGGHNLLEPAALNLPFVTGPHTYNAVDIAQLFRKAGVAPVVHNAEELATEVITLLGDPAERRRRGERSRELIDDSRGALGRLLLLLKPLLD